MSLLDTASLILTPNGYKEGKLYSVIPSSGAGDMSVTRATTATRVNSAGLVELVPYNLLTYSEQFDNANWGGFAVSVTADTSISPSGLLNADTINITSSSGYRRQLVSTLNSSNYTFSAYVKKSANTGTNLFRLYYNNNTVSPNNGEFRAVIDLTNLTITTTTTGTITKGRPTIISSNLTSVGNGWYRAEISFTTGTAAASTNSEIGFQSNGTTAEFLAWGAQLVEGTNAKDYQRTETRLNIPRLDYSNGSCPSLLVEPQRTNLALYSSSFDSSIWTPQNIFIGTNGISPSGLQDAKLISASGSTTEHNIYTFSGVSVTANQNYTYSSYIKKGSGRYICVVMYWAGVGFGPYATYDLNTNTLVSSGADNGTYVSSNIEELDNGWVRLSVTGYGNYTSLIVANDIRNAANLVPGTFFAGVGESFYIWGAQTELGSYSTSYIPTTSASVTRNADSVSKTGITSLIGQTEGTIFFDVVINGCQNALANLINTEKNTNTAFAIGYIKASKNIYGHVFDGSEKGRIQGGTFEIGQRLKIAYAYKSGNFALYVNGVALGTNANTFTFPSTLDDIFIGDPVTFFNWQESISNNVTAIWKTRLTNAQLAQLTTI